MQQAKPVAHIAGRQEYRGGWPLGFTTAVCPADAPVGCQSNPSYNLNCCPSGQFCFGTLQPYCCPTDDDCGAAVKNVPVCANSSWNMFHIEQYASENYFCCPNGYIGVLPARGSAGICEVEGVNIPKSQLATMASQIGGASVTSFGGIATASRTSAESSTSTGTTFRSSVTTAGQATQTGSSASGDGAGASSNSPISTGAIAGIAVGAAAVLVLGFALILWLHRRSLRKRPSQAAVGQTANTSEPTPQDYNKAAGETQAEQSGFAPPDTPIPAYGYSASPGIFEIPATSRAEMEAPADRMNYDADRIRGFL